MKNLDQIMTPDAVQEFHEKGEVSPAVYDRLYDYYVNNGEMPYGVAKARDGDPDQWIYERLAEEYPEAMQ